MDYVEIPEKQSKALIAQLTELMQKLLINQWLTTQSISYLYREYVFSLSDYIR